MSAGPGVPALRKAGTTMSWSGNELSSFALGCFLLANLILCVTLGLALIWWFKVGRVNAVTTESSQLKDDGGWSGPELVLAERFARGEIDDAEYRSRLETLRTASGGPRVPTVSEEPRPVAFPDARRLA
jgi:putative membrane protein